MRCSPFDSRLTALLLLLTCFAISRNSSAQTGVQLANRRLFLEQAQHASASGDHQHALELAQRASDIHQTASVRLFIAQEERALGRFAAAMGDADQCAIDASRDQTVPNRAMLIEQCQTLATSLHAQVASITIQIARPYPNGLRVTVGGDPLDPSLFESGTVVSAGTVVVEASAEGRRPFRREVQIAPGTAANVDILLPIAVVQAAPVHREAETSSGGFHVTALRWPGVGIFAVGVVALAIGATAYVDTSGAYSRCLATHCPLNQRPVTEDLAGVISMWAGGALLVAGATFFLVGTLLGRPRSSTVGFWVEPGGTAGVMGRF